MPERVEVGSDGYLRERSVFQGAAKGSTSRDSSRHTSFSQLSGSHGHAYVLVQDQRIRYADASLCRLTETEVGTLVGTPVVREPRTHTDPNTEDEEKQTQPNTEISRCQATIRYTNGQKRSVTLTGKPVNHEGRQAELFIITELSPQPEDETAESPEMREVGRIAQGIAHDLNNILQNILGPAELLRNEKLESPQAQTCLDQIIEACKRGGGLIERLLTFTRQDEPVFKTIHLQNIVETVRHNLSYSIPGDFSITVDIPDDLWPITASGSHMAQMLAELAANAQETDSAQDGIEIEARNIRITDKDHPEAPRTGAFVVVTVSDEGAGMDAATQAQAFEPFFTTKGRSEHSGLGLPLIQDIVTMHHGSVHCNSSPGGGTTFRIYLPANPKTSEESSEASQETPGTPQGSVLIVDDDENICWATQMLLEKYGHQVTTASNGREALQLYEEQGDSIDLIILDLVMPEMDGEICLNHLREMDPDVTVIIASGSISDQAKRRRLAERAREYVSKPFNSDALLQAVHEALEEAK